MPLVELDNVVKEYRDQDAAVRALDGVSLAVEPGEFVSLVGRSGCGKTTMLNLAGAMDFPTSGAVTLDGQQTTGLEDAVLQEYADNYLSEHGVRVLTEGMDVPGLEHTVASVLGEVHLPAQEFGYGLIAVRMRESHAFEPAVPYLEIDGRVEVAIEGGDARTYSTPFHVVSSGVDVEEARFRAARSIHAEVERIVRATLRAMAETGG